MSPFELNRRNFVGGTLAAAIWAGVRQESCLAADQPEGKLKLFWGDLHNHNAVGYAKGSLERSIALAREHLDFFSFTGHASWHDMPKMPNDAHLKWVNGFKVHSDHWPKTRELMREANSDDFVALLGYEWHSSTFGDYCMIFPQDQPDLFLPDHADKLLDFADEKGSLAIPHHVGYKLGWRGANWSHYRAKASPVVEVYSEHGCTISDRAPYPMIRHSNGGRSASQTIEPQLKKGMRFGFVASTDNHRGYPGAYGEGAVGVWAEELTSKALFQAIRARRTYACTGDRIVVETALNGHPMGSEMPATGDREIDVRVEGQDAIQMIELVRNGRVIQRHFPEDHLQGPLKLPGRAKCRIDYGWGPWGDLGMGRTCLWDMQIKLDGGQFLQALPCFQSAPFDEKLRDKLQLVANNELRLQSNTTRVQCYDENPTKSVILHLEGRPNSVLTVKLSQPSEQTIRAKLSDLVVDNVVTFTGPFTTESYIINRLVGPSEYTARVRWQDAGRGREADWYYVRVTQFNGQTAWSSPIWVG